jgi:membrane-associated phospholipid phosphatase
MVPGQWRPTPPNFANGVTPDWGAVTPFVIPSGSAFRSPPPPSVGSADYNDALLQVQCWGGTIAPSDAVCGQYALTPAQKAANDATALFWSNDANGTYKPPGQWVEATVGISTSLATPLSLLQDARLFALVATAMGDASIAQWDNKFFYNVWRPVSAVNDPSNPNYDPNTLWWPALNTAVVDQTLPVPHGTPAFPAYGSGHSTFGAAVATVLADFFGTDQFTFTVASDSTAETRTYTSFSAASAEKGLSRIYGGVHYNYDNTSAVVMGTQVGNAVFAGAFDVPEPGSLVLLASGFAGAAAVRRRRGPSAQGC